ncbi:MAG: hypothetical protein JWO95_1363 [Verrucomicrobiales bacterium]|nr:hypothetical protein [Verrucomicrobiales bacterium]
MTKPTPIAVVTTVQGPTKSIHSLLETLRPAGCPLLIFGDEKGPVEYEAPGTELFTLKRQMGLPFKLAGLLSTGHYARKNLGYLVAMERGATCIYETDDDNAPLPNWTWRDQRLSARKVPRTGWINAYRSFSDEHIWPRGFPLNLCHISLTHNSISKDVFPVDSPIQQGLANGSPDVDALWRLMMDKTIAFREAPSLYLPKGAWCPFNSQSTWWFPAAYALMYLPSNCSFRMTDIWRSFVAQRCLWELGTGVTFHGPEVVQARNHHDLMRNFEEEISGYLQNTQIAQWLDEVALKSGSEAIPENMLKCYELLIERGVFPAKELDLVRAWLEDVKVLQEA